jgi:hypothetical protein
MSIAIPDVEALDQYGKTGEKFNPEKIYPADSRRELAKLNPQGHIHASRIVCCHQCGLSLLLTLPCFEFLIDQLEYPAPRDLYFPYQRRRSLYL